MECELGKTATQFVTLENPTNEELIINYKISNKQNFDVIPERIILNPYQALDVCIEYTPSNLDLNESATIYFYNKMIGKWEFYVEGRGLVPTVMDQQLVSTSVANSISNVVQFKNPFKSPSTVSVSMETDDVR